VNAPARPPGPVPIPALQALLAAFTASAPAPPDALALVDLPVASAHARRFKLDVSFALDGHAHARFSVNDKGEPGPFRERLYTRLPALGVPPALLADFFALSPPGQVQTTVSVKWHASKWRIGLYYEELLLHPDGPALIDRAFERFLDQTSEAPPPNSQPVALCIDVTEGVVTGAKDYHMVTERPGEPTIALPPGLGEVRDGLPWHPINDTRRYLLARRYGPDGPAGAKLLWMTESWDAGTAAAAWEVVDGLRSRFGFPEASPSRALDALRAGWPFSGEEAFLFPDLVGLNVGPEGRPEALLVYVSVR
jgi:hypothetical protein